SEMPYVGLSLTDGVPFNWLVLVILASPTGCPTEIDKEKPMIKARFIYLTMTAVIVASASTVIPSMHSSKAKVHPSVVEADLRNEQRIIGTYLDDLFALDKEAGALGKRARLVSADLEPVERK